MRTQRKIFRVQKSTTVAGFTIVEMMVALALFTIVMTIATGAFLSLIGGSSQLQAEQTIMTSLNFAMDSMTREIRTGTRYYCVNNAETRVDDLIETSDCAGSDSFSFVESGSSLSNSLSSGTTTGQRITYYINFNAGKKQLMRQIGFNDSDGIQESLLSSDVTLESLKFFVSGADSLSSGDVRQPTVTIIIEAQDPNDATGKVYTLETTVTQRELDI